MATDAEQPQAARLRQPPVERYEGDVHAFDLAQEAARLRAEPHPATNGHRQIVLFRQDPVSLVLFDFDAGGRLSDHVADGVVTILVLAGRAEVRTADGVHALPAGGLLVLRPGVTHDLVADEASRVLVGVHLSTPAGT